MNLLLIFTLLGEKQTRVHRDGRDTSPKQNPVVQYLNLRKQVRTVLYCTVAGTTVAEGFSKYPPCNGCCFIRVPY